MRLALSTAHASWHPHRSGYASSLRPDEYGTARLIGELLAPMLIDDGHEVFVIEKTGKCDGLCVAGRCGRYSASIVNASKLCESSELSVEFHIDYRGAGQAGAVALCNNDDLAERFAGAFLDEWTARAPIGIAGRGVYREPEASKLFGRKWFLTHSAPAAVIVELGNVASATDSAYLSTTGAVRAAAEAAREAVRRATA